MKSGISALVASALALGALGAGTAHAQCARGAEYQQSEAVKRRYPDPAVRFDTPAFTPGKTGFTTYDEMMAYVKRVAAGARNVGVREAGYSQEGRVIPALVFTNAGGYSGADVRRLQRPTVLLVGQLHGNEPAGGEAMLALAQSLAS